MHGLDLLAENRDMGRTVEPRGGSPIPPRSLPSEAKGTMYEPDHRRTSCVGESAELGRFSRRRVIRTPLCDLLGIDHPIIQAGMGPFAPAVLAAAVSNAGALGSIGTFGLDPINLVRPADDLEVQFASIKELTVKPFAVNFVVPS